MWLYACAMASPALLVAASNDAGLSVRCSSEKGAIRRLTELNRSGRVRIAGYISGRTKTLTLNCLLQETAR
jgi:hypothetical protein